MSQEFEQDPDVHIATSFDGFETRLARIENLLQQVLDQHRMNTVVQQAQADDSVVCSYQYLLFSTMI